MRLLTTIKCDDKAFLERMARLFVKEVNDASRGQKFRVIKNCSNFIEYEVTGGNIKKTHKKMSRFWKRSKRLLKRAGLTIDVRMEE